MGIHAGKVRVGDDLGNDLRVPLRKVRGAENAANQAHFFFIADIHSISFFRFSYGSWAE